MTDRNHLRRAFTTIIVVALGVLVFTTVGIVRHEGSHLVWTYLAGDVVEKLSLLPSAKSLGSVRVAGSGLSWGAGAAPYLVDWLFFATGAFWFIHARPRQAWVRITAIVIFMVSPVIDTVWNYIGMYWSRRSDFSILSALSSRGSVNILFAGLIAAYALGAVIILLCGRQAEHGGRLYRIIGTAVLGVILCTLVSIGGYTTVQDQLTRQLVRQQLEPLLRGDEVRQDLGLPGGLIITSIVFTPVRLEECGGSIDAIINANYRVEARTRATTCFGGIALSVSGADYRVTCERHAH
jgi:hypothetical protein